MAGRKDKPSPRTARKTLTVDTDKLARARRLLGTTSDAETLRIALDYLLDHYQPPRALEEEE